MIEAYLDAIVNNFKLKTWFFQIIFHDMIYYIILKFNV